MKFIQHNGASHPHSKPEVNPEVRYLKFPGTGLTCTRTQRPQPFVQPLGGKTPLEDFFSQYPIFQHQPSNSPEAEFRRLCETYHWIKDDKIAPREAFRIAMKEEFEALYGSDEKDINNWYKLCHVLRIDPAPDTLPKCRAVSCRFSEPPCHCVKTSLLLFRPSSRSMSTLSTWSTGQNRKCASSKQKKSLANTRKQRENSFRWKTLTMVACCAPCVVKSYSRERV